MVLRLRTQMAATHGLVAVFTVFLVILVTYLLVNERFMDYISQKQFKEQQAIITAIETAGIEKKSKIAELGLNALSKGYFVVVKDKTGDISWEPLQAGEQVYNQAIEDVEKKVISHFGTFSSSEQTRIYKIKSEKNPLAEIIVTYYSFYFLTEHDLMFIQYLNTSLLWVAALAFLLSLILSTFLSSKISAQLAKIIRSAKDIANGENYQKQDLSTSHIVEIKELGEAIRHLEDSIHEKEAGNKRLTSDIAHELRTPITTLQSHLEALIEGIWQPTRERLVSCHEEIIRMASLVNDLEKLNKYDTAQIKLVKTNFNIFELVKNIYTNFESDFNKKQIQLKLSGEECEIFADRDKIGQVLVNIISNSLKYTPAKGRVFINVTYDEQFAYIVINDNGIGISKQDLPNIFNRLYRADISRTRATGGAGIGLAVAKAIIEAHKGQIAAVSQEGKGSEFTIIIPKK